MPEEYLLYSRWIHGNYPLHDDYRLVLSWRYLKIYIVHSGCCWAMRDYLFCYMDSIVLCRIGAVALFHRYGRNFLLLCNRRWNVLGSQRWITVVDNIIRAIIFAG
jgi:hypothetical protein